MRRPAVAAVLAYVALLAAFVALIAVPFLAKKREYRAAVPSPSPLTATSLDVVGGGKRICMTDLAMTPQSERVQFQVGTYFKPGPPLLITAHGADYQTTTRVPGGYADNLVHLEKIAPPPRSELVTLCVRNLGTRRITFYAAADRAHSRVRTFVAGKEVYPSPRLAFYEAEPRTIWANLSLTANRIAIFRGFLGHPWLVWLLGVLTVLGLPGLLGFSLWRAFASEPDIPARAPAPPPSRVPQPVRDS